MILVERGSMKFNGIELYEIKSDKFKTKTVNVFFCDVLKEETASYNSLLTTVLKRGTAEYPSAKDLIIRGQELYDTRIYTDIDKKGELQIAGFTVSVIDEKYVKDNPRIFEDAVDLLYEVLMNPLTDNGGFKEEYLQQEKQNLCDLIDSKINNKSYYATFRCFEEMCKGEPYSVDEMGDIERIQEISAAQLYDYYRNRFLTTLPIKIFITGDVQQKNIEYVQKKFEGMERKPLQSLEETVKLLPARKEVKTVTEAMNVMQGKLCLGFRTMTDLTSADYYALSICNMVFGGGTESKLFQNVREKESLAYYVYSRIDKFKGLMIVASGIEAKDKDRALELVLQQLEDIKQGSISDSEFESAVNSYIDAANQMNDGQRTLAEFFLGQMLYGAAVGLEEIIEKVKLVTREAIAEAAKKIQLDTVYFLMPEEG